MYTFLADSGNKDELFKFLASELAEKMNMPGCNIVTTQREYVLSTQDMDTDAIQSCGLEPRTIILIKDHWPRGGRHQSLPASKTCSSAGPQDCLPSNLVVATAMSIFNSLKDLGLSEL